MNVCLVTVTFNNNSGHSFIGRKRRWFSIEEAVRALQGHKPVQASYFQSLRQSCHPNNGAIPMPSQSALPDIRWPIHLMDSMLVPSLLQTLRSRFQQTELHWKCWTPLGFWHCVVQQWIVHAVIPLSCLTWICSIISALSPFYLLSVPWFYVF